MTHFSKPVLACAFPLLGASACGSEDVSTKDLRYPIEHSPDAIGMVVNLATFDVTVFDADADAAVGSVAIPERSGNCLITADATRGFVTTAEHQVVVVDLSTSPPSLASPITISNTGSALAFSPDQNLLLVCGGAPDEPISVVDVATQTEIDTFDLGHGCRSLAVCSDGSVLVASITEQNVRRLTLDAAGALSDTGEVLALGDNPQDVACAPDGNSGLLVNQFGSKIFSFSITGLSLVDERDLSGEIGMSVVVSPAGDRVFVRTHAAGPGGFIDAFAYDPETAEFGASPLFTTAIDEPIGTAFLAAFDAIALHPSGSKLYVSRWGEPSSVGVYDTTTGALLSAITDPSILSPLGVCVGGAPTLEVTVDVKPGDFPNSINPRSRGVIPVAILSTPSFDATTIDPLSVTFGPNQATEAHGMGHFADIDGDGDIDLVLHFRTADTGIQCGDSSVSLSGRTVGGAVIDGFDSIQTVGCR